MSSSEDGPVLRTTNSGEGLIATSMVLAIRGPSSCRISLTSLRAIASASSSRGSGCLARSCALRHAAESEAREERRGEEGTSLSTRAEILGTVANSRPFKLLASPVLQFASRRDFSTRDLNETNAETGGSATLQIAPSNVTRTSTGAAAGRIADMQPRSHDVALASLASPRDSPTAPRDRAPPTGVRHVLSRAGGLQHFTTIQAATTGAVRLPHSVNPSGHFTTLRRAAVSGRHCPREDSR